MKLFIPPVVIAEGEGFTPQNDIFKREPFGRGLAELVNHSEDGIVIGLDAPWGEGKTTFIKQWCGLLTQEFGISSLYFDAFAADYYDDPLVTLASELYEYIEKNEETSETPTVWGVRKEKFLAGAKKWGKAALVTGLRVGVKAASAGIVSLGDIGDVVGNTGKIFADTAEKELVSTSGDAIVNSLEQYFSSRKELKQGLSDIRNALSNISKDMKQASGKPFVFIIDELDRCRPDFALDLLERVKHIFNVPGMAYLLVYNSSQLEGHVHKRYGTKVQAKTYLTKFIDISLRLPKKEMNTLGGGLDNDSSTYVKYILERLDIPEGRLHRDTLHVLSGLAVVLKLSFRDLERIFSYMALYHNSIPDKRLNMFNVILGLCVLRVMDNKLFDTVASGKPSWDFVHKFFMFDELSKIEAIASTVEWFMEEWRACTEIDKPLNEKGVQLINSLHAYGVHNRASLIKIMASPFYTFLQTEQ